MEEEGSAASSSNSSDAGDDLLRDDSDGMLLERQDVRPETLPVSQQVR